MKLPSIVRLPEPKKFNYTPRYYDPIEDEIKAKEEKYLKQKEEKGHVSRISFRNAIPKKANSNKFNLLIRLALIIMMLWVIYFMMP